MSSEVSRSSSPRWIAGAVALALATVVVSCVGPDAFNRDGFQTGAGGNDGLAGQTGNGGSGLGGAAMGGQTGAGGSGVGGKTCAGGSGTGGALGAGGSAAGGRTGTGGSGTGGAPGVGGKGMGGTIAGMGGAIADGGNDADGAGADSNGAGGMTGVGGASGCPPGIYCDNFESYTVGAQPPTWTRLGGSSGDWAIVTDGTQALAQNHALSSTFRANYSSGAAGAPWSGPTTLSVQVKVTANGSSSPTVALACVRYTTANEAYCLALMPGMGAQLQVRSGQTVSSGSALFPVTVTVGTQYNAQISVDGAGLLSASLDGTALGTLTAGTAVASGFVGVATQSAEATFDNVVVTQP